MTPAERKLAHATDVIREVRLRLEHVGDLVGLHHLAGFSVDELDLLVRREREAPPLYLLRAEAARPVSPWLRGDAPAPRPLAATA